MANRIIDGGFEYWDSATDATYWTESVGGSSTINRESTVKRAGKYSCRFDIDGSNSIAYVYQEFYMIPGRKYRVVIWYKMSDASATAYLHIRDHTQTVNLLSDATWSGSGYITLANSMTWKRYVLEFTAHASYWDYDFYLTRLSATSASIYFDNVGVDSCDKAGFAWDNKWDSGTLTASSSATNFPANNTRHRWHQKTWRSANLASPDYLLLDAGANRDVSLVLLRYTNFQSNATLLIQANTADNWASPIIMQGLISNTEIIPFHWATTLSYQYWRFTITDATNPSNYVEVGRAFIGVPFEPERNAIIGGGMKADIDPSTLSMSDDGQVSAILKTHYKTGSFTFRLISAADKAQFEALFANVGFSSPFFFIEDMGDPWNDGYYVYIESFDITPEYDNQFTVAISLREAR